MHILCPHCHNPIELVRITPREEINCPSCGSSFNLDTGSTGSESTERKTLGKFEIIETVGHGAFGTVYKARDPELDRTVALKVPRAGNLAGPQELDRFVREARSVAQLRHPSIVTVHDVGQSDGVPYLVSDFVEGMTLADLLSARKPSFRESAQLAADIADALQYAHDQGVVHRDVKPSNIMLESPAASASERSSLTPRLMDFGLAKRDAGEITMTMDGQVLGTPAYMSPEQARGEGHDVDGRSDVYSVGVVLYQLLTGELPFRGTTRMLLHQVLHDEPRSPRSINDRIPRDLETICLKAMAKEPERRYSAASGLASDLRRFLNGEPIQARPVGRLERAWRWCRRNPALAGSLTVAASALLLGTVVSLWFAVQADQRRRDAVQALDRAEREQKARVLAQVNTLRDAAPAAVPPVLAELKQASEEVLPRLRELWADKDGDPRKRMRVGLALLAVEPDAVRDELTAWILRATDPAEVVLVRDTLTPHGAALTDRLWTTAADDSAKAAERLRALVALAAFDAEDGRWKELAPVAVTQMLADPLYLGIWAQGFKPIREKMLAPLGDVFRTAQSPERREFAATVLAVYASENADALADLLLDADPKQYAVLFPVVEKHRERAVERMKQALARVPDYWKDAPLDPSWTTVPEELRREIEDAEGMVAERWALCQALPMERLAPVTEGLRKSGYRPIRAALCAGRNAGEPAA